MQMTQGYDGVCTNADFLSPTVEYNLCDFKFVLNADKTKLRVLKQLGIWMLNVWFCLVPHFYLS